jgi:hypothetical protein
MMAIDDRVRQILTDLDRTRENLLALSDDIWLNIDHNDARALKEGVEFKLAYNEKLSEFSRLADELSRLIQSFTSVSTTPPEDVLHAGKNSAETQHLIRELDRSQPHTLEEDFTYKRPYGFVLQGQPYTRVPTWRRVYELVCRQLAGQDPKRFATLPDNPKFITKNGHKGFSTQPNELRVRSHIAEGVYVEVHFSANDIRDSIKRLLTEFGVEHDSMVIYLREDRDAEETNS